VKVERLIGGWMTASAALWRQGEDPQEKIRFPVPAYLVETDTERTLIDTGLHPGACADAASHYDGAPTMGLFSFEQDESVSEQVDAATITKIVLTHLHWDHAGGLSLLPSSIPVVVQRREWEAGADSDAIARNFFFPRDYVDDEREVILIDGDHDLLGDGSVELLLTPGHTPGHQSLRIGEAWSSGSTSPTSTRASTTTACPLSATTSTPSFAPPNVSAPSAPAAPGSFPATTRTLWPPGQWLCDRPAAGLPTALVLDLLSVENRPAHPLDQLA
jgi:glyoxylase-like metal-dependent hydrolase (beta-lactamase superfamily II)